MSNFQSSLCSFLWEISTTLPRTRWLCDLWKMKFKTKVFILTHILLRKKGNLNHWIPLTSIHWSLYISALPLEMVKNLSPASKSAHGNSLWVWFFFFPCVVFLSWWIVVVHCYFSFFPCFLASLPPPIVPVFSSHPFSCCLSSWVGPSSNSLTVWL